MTEITKGLHIVDGLTLGGSSMNVAVILDSGGAATIVDTGLPGNGKKILDYIEKQTGKKPKVEAIILTHMDGDHVGSAMEIKREAGGSIIAQEIDGRVMGGEMYTRDQLKKMYPEYNDKEIDGVERRVNGRQYPPVMVDRALKGGEKLDIAGGAQFFHIPGHTPGHMVVYFPKVSALVMGDTLTSSNGAVTPPNPEYTISPKQADQSLKKLRDLEFEILIPYHSPPITKGGSEALRRYIDGVK